MENVSTYLFTQGVLGVCVVALVIDRNRLLKREEEKDKRIDELQTLRLQDTVNHAKDFRELASHNQEYIQQSSQTNALLIEKIDVVKRGQVK